MKKLCWMATILFSTVMAFADTIPWRGVVEGYYGRPWGTEGRISLLKFMGEHDMNVFIYGPKDDPYHHSKWREAYPEKEMEDFRKILRVADENHVKFYWAIHLGGTFKNTPEDYEALFRKLNWMYDAGFRAFAVFFDDFGSADAHAHAEICNRIEKEFIEKKGDCAPLIMCPNVYWGSGHPYQKTLGAELDKKVHIMWTGHTICDDIRLSDVEKITADFQRPPFVWWNWPVNDYCRSKLQLGRTYGLEDAQIAGFVSNPMENCEANKIGLYSIAKWCQDPVNFNSEKTWEESFTALFDDPEVAEAMRIFAEHNSDQGPNGHGYRREESASAMPLVQKANEEYRKTGKLTPETAHDVGLLFNKLRMSSLLLESKLPTGRYDLGWELAGWLAAERYQMKMGHHVLELLTLKDEDERLSCLHVIRAIRQEAEKSARRHQEKFAAATFEKDRKNVAPPKVSTREIQPLIELLLEVEMSKMYEKKFGKPFEAAKGFSGISWTKSMEKLIPVRNGKYAGLARVLEQKEVLPGESFGIRVPQAWKTDYFHAKLDNPEAVKAGVIEVSKDGQHWEKLNTWNRGQNMERAFKESEGWRWARYRNVSDKPVSLKINMFKFDIRAAASTIDELLEELCD